MCIIHATNETLLPQKLHSVSSLFIKSICCLCDFSRGRARKGEQISNPYSTNEFVHAGTAGLSAPYLLLEKSPGMAGCRRSSSARPWRTWRWRRRWLRCWRGTRGPSRRWLLLGTRATWRTSSRLAQSSPRWSDQPAHQIKKQCEQRVRNIHRHMDI